MSVRVDPVTRHLEVTYEVPASAADEVTVRCTWAEGGSDQWHPARVRPMVSDTAMKLVSDQEWAQWIQGLVTERRAGGLKRTVIFDPYPEAQVQGRVEVRFHVSIEDQAGAVLATYEVPLSADNTDVVYLTGWSKVLQHPLVSLGEPPIEGGWGFRPAGAGESFGELTSRSGRVPVRALTYPLDLKGWYAVCVRTPAGRAVRIRLSAQEYEQTLGSPRPGQEALWDWMKLDRQHLVITPPLDHTGQRAAGLNYVKLVPLTGGQAQELEAPLHGPRVKQVITYFEPYSWAFDEEVLSVLQHHQPLAAMRDVGITDVDAQVSRVGMKAVYETRVTDQLLGTSHGDPLQDGTLPITDHGGLMQQYTNTLEDLLRYGRELGVKVRANFGAANAYPGTGLMSELVAAHPDWLRGPCVRYELPEVRAYVLGLYREVLEIGARAVSIDYCRYPECLDSPETGVLFHRELRKLTDEYTDEQGNRVEILVHFPVIGAQGSQNMDFASWAREGLVDIIVPSNVQGRFMSYDVAPYLEAVRGTRCTLLVSSQPDSWGLPTPGMYLWRVRQLYGKGVAGVYNAVVDRHIAPLLACPQALERWWQDEEQLQPRRSKGIYLNRALYTKDGYNRWERLRVWVEGVPMGEVELYLDGQLVNHCDGPPYILGGEAHTFDKVIPPGKHALLVRARDGEGWLEQTFQIQGAGKVKPPGKPKTQPNARPSTQP